MTKEGTPAIDPRYDPIFQRGFSGASPTRIRAVEPPRDERPAPPRRPDSQRAESQRADPQRAEPQRAEPQRAAAFRGTSDERVDSFVVPPAESAVHDETLTGADEPDARDGAAAASKLTLRGNPWVATLWVVAVLLLTAGFFGTWRSQSIYVGATPINDMNEIVTFQVLQTLSPSLVLVGLLVLGGLVFLHAVSWRAKGDEDT